MTAKNQEVLGGVQLWLNLGDAPNQAARLVASISAAPSVNLTPSMTIGKWLAPFNSYDNRSLNKINIIK